MLNNKRKAMQSDVQKNASFNDRRAAAAAAKQAINDVFVQGRPSTSGRTGTARREGCRRGMRLDLPGSDTILLHVMWPQTPVER